MDSYNSSGKLLVDSYYSFYNDECEPPLILPPAFHQDHVDLYTTKDLETGAKSRFDSKRRDFDDERKVYHALENINQKCIVLHGFEYSEAQWKDLVQDNYSCKV